MPVMELDMHLLTAHHYLITGITISKWTILFSINFLN